MWCNVGFAEDADCNTLNECLDKGYVQIDKILFKELVIFIKLFPK